MLLIRIGGCPSTSPQSIFMGFEIFSGASSCRYLELSFEIFLNRDVLFPPFDQFSVHAETSFLYRCMKPLLLAWGNLIINKYWYSWSEKDQIGCGFDGLVADIFGLLLLRWQREYVALYQPPALVQLSHYLPTFPFI